jgi:hypothetical protein
VAGGRVGGDPSDLAANCHHHRELIADDSLESLLDDARPRRSRRQEP